jgi:PKD repeat protein
MEAISSMRVSSILKSANHYYPKMPFEIPSKGDHFPRGRIDQTVEKTICAQAPLALKTDPTKEGHVMTYYLARFNRCLAAFLCLLFLAFSVITCSIQTKAQTGPARIPTQREHRVQVFFMYSPSRPIAQQGVQFTDSSKGNPTSWQWDFGDGVTSTLQNPSHTFAAAGSYKVVLAARNSSNLGNVSRTINVAASSFASFNVNPTYPMEGQNVQFTDTSTGSPNSWQWDFGDGGTSALQNPSHTFAVAGFYKVTMLAGSHYGLGSVSRIINVVTLSFASFTYSPSSPVAGQAVYFTDTSTGSSTSWQWNFGDGTTSTSKNPSHIYATAASYTVTLTVAYIFGPKSASQTVNVLSPSTLSASFTFSPSSPAAGQTVYFTDTSTGSPTSWQWNFGDGATSTSKNPNHTYSTVSSYIVTLTVSNSTGSNSATQMISVLSPSTLNASFTYSPSSPAAGQAVQFTDTSTGGATSWQWDFGDSATSTIQNPSHTYTAVGSYLVTLTITKGTNSNSTNQIVTVRERGTITAASPSYADVSAAINSAVSGDTVIVPAGSATWTDHLIITKSIYLIGAGIGQTVITSNYTAPDPSYSIDPHQSLISFVPASPADNPLFRLSGMTINCASKCHAILLYNATRSICNKIRLDHLDVYGAVYDLTRYGTVYGVMDNCTVHDLCGNMGLHSYWTYTPYDFGGSDNFYFEDCNFVGVYDSLQDGNESPRYAIRHCSITGARSLFPLLDMHGNQASSGHSATQGGEIYENTITMGSFYLSLLDQRGGKVLCYNNSITSSYGASTKVREEENDSLMPPANNVISGQPQHVSDSYYWGNRLNTSTIINAYVAGTVDYGGQIGLVPQENREFWNENPSFNGTTGIGVGPLANRPISCTKGVAYWATDTRTLYKCTATNVWTEYYKPLTYPHPLRAILSNQDNLE